MKKSSSVISISINNKVREFLVSMATQRNQTMSSIIEELLVTEISKGK
ncbi:MAG: hypothetical protein WC915_03650 [archaeon]|jgi:hypothetical protein